MARETRMTEKMPTGQPFVFNLIEMRTLYGEVVTQGLVVCATSTKIRLPSTICNAPNKIKLGMTTKYNKETFQLASRSTLQRDS